MQRHLSASCSEGSVVMSATGELRVGLTALRTVERVVVANRDLRIWLSLGGNLNELSSNPVQYL